MKGKDFVLRSLELFGQLSQFFGVHPAHVWHFTTTTEGTHQLFHFAPLHFFHHLLHLSELLDQ